MRFHTAYPSTSLFSAATSVRAQAPYLWDAYNNLFKDAKYIDLTHAFEPVQAVWPGFGNAKFKAARAGAKSEREDRIFKYTFVHNPLVDGVTPDPAGACPWE